MATCLDPLLQKIPKAGLTQLSGTVSEGTDPGNDKRVTTQCIGRFTNMDAVNPGMLDGALDAAEIAAPVINQSQNPLETHSTPFVLGIPFTRSSRETATSSARASALKTASAM